MYLCAYDSSLPSILCVFWGWVLFLGTVLSFWRASTVFSLWRTPEEEGFCPHKKGMLNHIPIRHILVSICQSVHLILSLEQWEFMNETPRTRIFPAICHCFPEERWRLIHEGLFLKETNSWCVVVVAQP